MRDKVYKEDSTRGQSLINPLNYKGDVLVQVWVDSRVLATLCQWLDESGTYPNYLSQVVRRPLEVLTDLLVNEGSTRLVDNTVEARELLQKRFKVDLNRGGRGTKNTMHNISLSIKREELAESIKKSNRINDIDRPLRVNQNPLVDRAIAKYKELFAEEAGQPLKEKENSLELIQERIKANDEIANKQLDELNNFNLMELLNKSIK
jgi:hypothetical protein